MVGCPVRGESKTLIRLTLQKPEISFGSMGQQTRKGFSFSLPLLQRWSTVYEMGWLHYALHLIFHISTLYSVYNYVHVVCSQPISKIVEILREYICVSRTTLTGNIYPIWVIRAAGRFLPFNTTCRWNELVLGFFAKTKQNYLHVLITPVTFFVLTTRTDHLTVPER